jgi:hypothetical protein
MHPAMIRNVMKETFASKRKISAIITAIAFLFLFSVSSFQYSAAVTGSISFGAIQNLSKDSGSSTAPVVAAVSYNGHTYVYVAWEDTSSGSRDTYFTSSVDGGAFTSPIVFTGISGKASVQLDAVQIAAPANSPYVYMTWDQGGQTVWAASANNGVTWYYNIMPDASDPSVCTCMTAEAVTATSNYAFFTWADNVSHILESMIQYTGSGFTTPTTPFSLTQGAASFSAHGEDESASVTVGPVIYAYVVWDSIYFVRWNSTYGVWSAPENIHPPYCTYSPSFCLAREPMISASGNNVYVTFPGDNGSTSGSTGSYHTYVAISNDNGIEWLNDAAPGVCYAGATGCNPAHDLSTKLDNTREVQVSSYGDDVYVTSRGQGSLKGTQQYVYVSTNDGALFSPPISVTGTTALSGSESGFGSVQFDQASGTAYVYWPHGSPSQVYVANCPSSCAAGSSSWTYQQVSTSSSSPVVLLGDPGGSQGPMLAALNGIIYMVWEDSSVGGGDIMFVAST